MLCTRIKNKKKKSKKNYENLFYELDTAIIRIFTKVDNLHEMKHPNHPLMLCYI